MNDYTQNLNLEFDNFLSLKSIYHQPGIWINLKAIKNKGLNIKSHYYFDFFFYLSHFKNNPKILYTNEILAHFRVHSQSKTSLIQSKSQLEMINFFKKIYKTQEFKSKKSNILKVIKYLESIRLVNTWLSLSKKEKSAIAFVKLIFSNITYLEINFYWKFLIKYIVNFNNIRNKNYI
jgi:hypothetical protein